MLAAVVVELLKNVSKSSKPVCHPALSSSAWVIKTQVARKKREPVPRHCSPKHWMAISVREQVVDSLQVYSKQTTEIEEPEKCVYLLGISCPHKRFCVIILESIAEFIDGLLNSLVCWLYHIVHHRARYEQVEHLTGCFARACLSCAGSLFFFHYITLPLPSTIFGWLIRPSYSLCGLRFFWSLLRLPCSPSSYSRNIHRLIIVLFECCIYTVYQPQWCPWTLWWWGRGIMIIREVRWVRCPGSDRTRVSPVRTEPDGPQKRLGES